MAFINHYKKEITVKIVYYGPALSGKTSCLRYIYTSNKFRISSNFIELLSENERAIFLDHFQVEIGRLKDYSVKVNLYSAPGARHFESTKKLVLHGADGIVFVADIQRERFEENI